MLPRKPRGGPERLSVFLNIPYDKQFENLYLAYIAGLSAFGLIPRATLEIPTSQRRLERILKLIGECAYSIHDLSRVQLDRKAPRVPRFNMSFELGLAVAQSHDRNRNTWYVCESVAHRIHKSLSDLDGTDVRIHNGTVRGVFAALCDVFVRKGQQPSVQEMNRIYRSLRRSLPKIMQQAGARSPYGARVFHDLILAATSEQRGK
ncbi:MAG TPA: hypothetical protein VF753_21370 [Terriglobales bacterium]